MKKKSTQLITLLLALTVIVSSHMQAQSSCAWAKKTGGSYEDNGTAITTDASGNVYSLGYFYSPTLLFNGTPNVTLHNTYGGACMYLAKYDSCGNFQWAKQANGHDGGDVYGAGLTTDASGNVYVTGFFQADTLFTGSLKAINSGYKNVFIIKYNTAGVALWISQSTGTSQDRGNDIALDASGNIFVTGAFNSPSIIFGSNNAINGTNDGFTYDAFVAKFDVNGNNLWVKATTSNVNTFGDVNGYGIGTDASGNVYAAGDFESDYIRFGVDSVANNGYRDIFLVKYSSNGSLQWLKTAGDTDDDGATSLSADASGNTYITGRIGGSSTVNFGTHAVTNAAINPTVFLAKYDATGTAQWAKSTAGDYYSYNEANSVTLDGSGNPYIIGSYSSDSLRFGNGITIFNASIANGGTGGDYNYDVFVAKYKANGNLSWARTAGGDSNDIGNGIAAGLNNSLYITGMYNSPSISFAGIPLANTTPNSSPSLGDAFVANNISTLMLSPDICLVSDDSIKNGNQYNVIYWDKTPYTTVSQFVFYREVSTGVYKKIGSQPYSALSEFVDTARSIGPSNGDPGVGAYKYTMQILDTNGTYSLMSPYHNTIKVTNNSGTFNWNLYTVGNATNTPVSNYYLMRDDNNTGVWGLVGTVSGGQTGLTDPNYSAYQSVANWRVDADGFSCTPTLRLAGGTNSTLAAKVKSHSNQSNNRSVGIKQNIINQQITIYPNPANSSFIIETSAAEKQQMQLMDISGRILLAQPITGKLSIDASSLSEGIYNISIIGAESVINKKLVIVK